MKCEARNGSWLLQRGSATGWMNPAGIIWYLNTKKHRMMIAAGRVHKGVPPWKSLSCGWTASNSTGLFLLGGPQEMAIELDTDMISSNNPTWKGNALDSPIICSCYRYWNGWWFGATPRRGEYLQGPTSIYSFVNWWSTEIDGLYIGTYIVLGHSTGNIIGKYWVM